MKRGEELQLLEIVGRIYDAALDLECWPAMLEALRQQFDAAVVGLTLVDESILARDDKPQIPFQFFHQVGGDDSFWRSYQQYYGALDPTVPFTTSYPEGSIFFGHEEYSHSEFKKTEFYHDWVRPQDVLHLAFGFPVREGGNIFVASVQRSESVGPFTDSDRKVFNALMPHLRRAFLLVRNSEALASARDAALTPLERWGLGIILLDETGEVAHLNERAETIVAQSGHLRLRGRRLTAVAPNEAESLRKLIHDATQTGCGKGLSAGGAVALHGSNGASHLNVIVSPVCSDRQPAALPGTRVCAAMFLSDPQHAPAIPGEPLQALYGLTPAEARLAAALAEGQTLAEASEQFGITRETARSQLKAIFDKTGARRQAELVRLVLTHPATLFGERVGQ